LPQHATVLAGPRIGEHVACQRGQSKCVVKFAIAQLITNKPVTLTGYLHFPVAAGLFRSKVEHAKRLWFTRDHLAMAQALGWDRVASFYIDLEGPVLPSGIPKPGPLQMHLPDDHMRYAIIWFSLAGLLLIAFAVWLRGRMPAPS
jgi:cytochrome oxidase assembly protein ShyY1